MERIVLARLQTFADDPVCGFPEELASFREGRGMQHTMLPLLNLITHANRQCQGTTVIFVDLEKAFELVDHHVVLMSVLERLESSWPSLGTTYETREPGHASRAPSPRSTTWSMEFHRVQFSAYSCSMPRSLL